MLKKLFNSVVDKYQKSKMTLIDIEEEQTKEEILKLLTLSIVVDGNVDDSEIIELAKFIHETLFVYKNLEEIKEIISYFLNNLENRSVDIYVSNFKNHCIILSDKLNNKQKDELLDVLIAFIQADGQIDSGEQKLLKLFRENIKYNGIFGQKNKIDDNCPGCRGGNTVRTHSEELDRWVKPKKVEEKLASGKYKTRYVNTTYIEERLYYKCQDCAEEFTTRRTREK